MFLDPWLPDFSFLFLSILVEGAPFILLGTIISGFIDVSLPSGAIDRLLPRNRGLAVLMSGLLGIIFPVCECAVVPVIRRLVKKGLPPACAITYMLAAPIVNPVTFLSTYSAFKKIPLEMAGSRLLFGYVIAVIVGLILLKVGVGRILKPRLAFLVFGPMMDVKLLFLYSTILSRKFILILAAGLFIGIGTLSVLLEPVFEGFERNKPPPFAQTAQD